MALRLLFSETVNTHTAFAPYAPPVAPPRKPEKPTAAEHRLYRTLAAVMWTLALAAVAIARYALTSFF